ncbi:unnamed protein product [Medioppia subpectinata]|uniref:RRM domain-containing protein n=1 Tax=Medioppia subpectinata TaxID=1979941 RepID=A0A7R9Q086_9ACAR|nr:unnamed protein product [Medioppia subpectinata]CAG2106977.1 unnamed protein product [Medioppia subpectinata]
MTSDSLEATLIDDSCFGDVFTMQSQFLDDFEFGLEANNINSLLELFEEHEKNNDRNLNYLTINSKSNNYNNIVIKANSEASSDRKKDNGMAMISSPKVHKSRTTGSSIISNTKSKGISLLAKPKKSSPKRSLLSMNDRDFDSFSSYLLQEHDYCLMTSNDSKKLYNKLPQYLTQLSDERLSDSSQDTSPTFDKIPNYIKGFLNYSDNIENIESDDNILIELNEAYIEVSDVFFDNEMQFESKLNSELFGEEEEEDMNSDSSNYSSLMSSEESKDIKQMSALDDHQLSDQNEQKDYINNNSDNKVMNRKSRSRSCEKIHKKYSSSTTRRRRLSTRSSVDSSSDNESSRSSSCSSCSSCDSYSSRNSNETKINFKQFSTSIIRNEKSGQNFRRKRSLKESYCQNNNRSKIRANFEIKSRNESVNNVKNIRQKSGSMNAKKDIDERKIIYVGKIPDGTTKTDIRHWFGRFGAIKEVSVHFRDYGDNYAFVTFYKRCDAYEAIEHANEDSRHPKFDLSFGGRRKFCKTRYEDLGLSLN